MSPPWRDIPERIKAVGDSQDFTLESEVSLPGLGQGLPRFARNDKSAFFGLFTNASAFDGFVKSQKVPLSVIPAKAGIQSFQALLDSRLRGSDECGDFLRMHQLLILRPI